MRARFWMILTLALSLVGVFPVTAQDGECLLFWDYHSEGRHIVNLDTGALTSYTYDLMSAHSRSPNGRYGLQYGTETGTLILIDLYSGATTTLTDIGDIVDWSLDGRYFAYLSGDGQHLMLYDTTSATTTLITDNGTVSAAYLSDDGQWLAYEQDSAADTSDLIFYNIADGTSQIFTMYVPIEAVEWSPDSTRIALALLTNADRETIGVRILSVLSNEIVGTVDSALMPIDMVWSPSGESLMLYTVEAADYMWVDFAAESQEATQISVDGRVPRFYWSPDESYLMVYHSPGDLATAFTLFDRQGEIIVERLYVPGYQYDFVPHHWWIDDGHLLLRQWVDGFHALIVIDAATGESQTLLNPAAEFALSPNSNRFAANELLMSPTMQGSRELQFYEWTGATFSSVRSVNLPAAARGMVWRGDGAELITLFEDRILRAYDYATDSWRDIATLPEDNNWNLTLISCVG